MKALKSNRVRVQRKLVSQGKRQESRGPRERNRSLKGAKLWRVNPRSAWAWKMAQRFREE